MRALRVIRYYYIPYYHKFHTYNLNKIFIYICVYVRARVYYYIFYRVKYF